MSVLVTPSAPSEAGTVETEYFLLTPRALSEDGDASQPVFFNGAPFRPLEGLEWPLASVRRRGSQSVRTPSLRKRSIRAQGVQGAQGAECAEAARRKALEKVTRAQEEARSRLFVFGQKSSELRDIPSPSRRRVGFEAWRDALRSPVPLRRRSPKLTVPEGPQLRTAERSASRTRSCSEPPPDHFVPWSAQVTGLDTSRQSSKARAPSRSSRTPGTVTPDRSLCSTPRERSRHSMLLGPNFLSEPRERTRHEAWASSSASASSTTSAAALATSRYGALPVRKLFEPKARALDSRAAPEAKAEASRAREARHPEPPQPQAPQLQLPEPPRPDAERDARSRGADLSEYLPRSSSFSPLLGTAQLDAAVARSQALVELMRAQASERERLCIFRGQGGQGSGPGRSSAG